MQKIIYRLVGTIISFAIAQYVVGGFQMDTTFTTYLIASIVFLLTSAVISPLLKIILFPINLLTLGLFQWVINILVLYIFDWLYDGITISAYNFAGFSSPFLTIGAGEVSLFWTLFFSSLVMSLTYNIFTSIFHD